MNNTLVGSGAADEVIFSRKVCGQSRERGWPAAARVHWIGTGPYQPVKVANRLAHPKQRNA
jgi:hypothetical protein